MTATTQFDLFDSTQCTSMKAFARFAMMVSFTIRLLRLDKVSSPSTMLTPFIDCGSSCSNQWAYQLSCFTCSSTQVYSLAQLKCVDAWASNEVLIASSLIHGLRVWRKLVYYVNPSSESILELGTQVNPYKNINLPLFELFNFVDASNQNVTVKISQDDTHYLVRSI